MRRQRRPRPSYATGIMVALCASLLCIGVLFHIPTGEKARRSGWRHLPPPRQERLGLREIREQAEASGYSVPATKLGLPTKHAEPLVRAQNPVEAPAEDTTKRSVRRDGLELLPALDIAEHMPNIEGGIGAYYINIAYPEEAKILGIQGRLVLHFVVETDGTTSRIRVHKPLHPLCDSAAVQALRRTIFIPGKQNGSPVRVRMSLPVSFQLIDLPATDSSTG